MQPTAGPTADPSAAASADAPPAPTEPPAPPAPPPVEYTRVIARIGKNHGHSFPITIDDVKAGVDKTYDLGKSAGHTHAITLTAAEMKDLLSGKSLRANSTKGLGHAHRLLVKCAPAEDPPEWVSACKVEFSGQDEHELIIPAADMAAKADRTYNIQGLAGHNHEVTVTAADFATLETGAAVSLKCSRDPDDAHLHNVFIRYKPKKA
ncbi:MAG: hypothetical protein R3F14_23855 [Polyangiaceae bacterium]